MKRGYVFAATFVYFSLVLSLIVCLLRFWVPVKESYKTLFLQRYDWTFLRVYVSKARAGFEREINYTSWLRKDDFVSCMKTDLISPFCDIELLNESHIKTLPDKRNRTFKNIMRKWSTIEWISWSFKTLLFGPRKIKINILASRPVLTENVFQEYKILRIGETYHAFIEHLRIGSLSDPLYSHDPMTKYTYCQKVLSFTK